MTITQTTDYETRAPQMILERYRKPTVMALLASWLSEVQQVENALWAILTQRGVANAVGAQLDVLGKLVGQPREGRSDDVYRLWVTARILVLRSSGQTEQLIAIAKKLVGAAIPIRVDEYYPLALVLNAEAGIDPALGSQIARLLAAAKGSAVSLLFSWFSSYSSQPFTFSTTTDSVLDALGFDNAGLSAVSGGSDVKFTSVPAQILDGLRVELDPTDVQTSGGLVTQFNNTYGAGGACAQASAANQATFVAADPAFANQPVAVFSGINNANGKAYPLTNLSDLTEGEAFVVLKPDYSFPTAAPPSGGSQMGLWTFGGPSDTLSGAYNWFGSTIYESFGLSTRYYFVNNNPINVSHIYNVRTSSAGVMTLYQSMSGVIYTSPTTPVFFPPAPVFGRSSNNGVYQFNGKLAYLAITSKVQTPAARAVMLQYLSKRFGIPVA